MSKLKCPVCNKKTKLVTGIEVYPHREDLKKKKFWACLEHDAFVGCHPDTTIPLGFPATTALRQLRSKVHKLFDPLWRDKLYFSSRNKAYSWLRKSMNLKSHETHIAMFNEVKCELALMVINNLYQEIKTLEHQKIQKDKWKPKNSLF